MIILSREQFAELVSHAKKFLPNEACGLLGGTISGDVSLVEKIYFLTNVDASPEHFSMDAQEQFAAVKDMRSQGWKLLGNFHSHPTTPARPSEEDKRLVLLSDFVACRRANAEKFPIRPREKCFAGGDFDDGACRKAGAIEK